MSITKNSNRQEEIVAWVDINMADLVNNVAQNAIMLPPNAVITGGDITCITAFDSTSSDIIDVGDSVTDDRYVSAASVHATGLTALVPTGYATLPTTRAVAVLWASGGGTPTVGKFRLTVKYFVLGRAAFAQD